MRGQVGVVVTTSRSRPGGREGLFGRFGSAVAVFFAVGMFCCGATRRSGARFAVTPANRSVSAIAGWRIMPAYVVAVVVILSLLTRGSCQPDRVAGPT